MQDILNKLVLITGGASGIGKLMAFEFARLGARVSVWDLNLPAMEALEREASAAGLKISAIQCDVASYEAVRTAASSLVKKEGPVDVLVNNAGIVSGKTLLETDEKKIEKTMDVNVLALFWLAKAFLPSMIERNSGHIVTIASAGGLIGVRGLADYCAAKFAAVGFDESLRMELRRIKSAVRTTVVCPFFLNTGANGMFDGVKTRFPLFLPILTSAYAARRIVRSVLKNKRRLIMPRFVYTVYLLRLLPTWMLDLVADFFGINHAMDEFKGHS